MPSLAMRYSVALILAAAIGVATPSASSAQTPSAYRGKLNAVCRSYTPRFRADWKKMAKAAKAKDYQAYGYTLGHALLLMLKEDAAIERTPVPAPMRTQMAPILRLLMMADRHAVLALTKARGGDNKGFIAEVDALTKMTGPLNKLLDGAGLRDCGSNQS